MSQTSLDEGGQQVHPTRRHLSQQDDAVAAVPLEKSAPFNIAAGEARRLLSEEAASSGRQLHLLRNPEHEAPVAAARADQADGRLAVRRVDLPLALAAGSDFSNE